MQCWQLRQVGQQVARLRRQPVQQLLQRRAMTMPEIHAQWRPIKLVHHPLYQQQRRRVGALQALERRQPEAAAQSLALVLLPRHVSARQATLVAGRLALRLQVSRLRCAVYP